MSEAGNYSHAFLTASKAAISWNYSSKQGHRGCLRFLFSHFPHSIHSFPLLPHVSYSAALILLCLPNPLFLNTPVLLRISLFVKGSGQRPKQHISRIANIYFSSCFYKMNTFVSPVRGPCWSINGYVMLPFSILFFVKNMRPSVSSQTQRTPHYFSKFHYRKCSYRGEAITYG